MQTKLGTNAVLSILTVSLKKSSTLNHYSREANSYLGHKTISLSQKPEVCDDMIKEAGSSGNGYNYIWEVPDLNIGRDNDYTH
jgi:hypothetical protein